MEKQKINDLLNIVKKILKGYTDESEFNQDIDTLRFISPDPEIENYIFDMRYNLSAEEIVEKALSYKPIITPPPPKKDD